MFPKMLGQPATRRTPDSPGGAINSAGSPPDIGIMMGHPPSCTIHVFRSLPACNSEVLCHLDERFMKFRQVCFFCWPVIHLSIDVDRVLTIPGWVDLIIPYSLEIGRLSAWLR